mmetsp:Transcript_40682/g.71093  ORF Transcript_40682/g.71093 Transcript_40682/m.71093 type:complete len:98 (+) Transcript_40682:297-590(+)
MQLQQRPGGQRRHPFLCLAIECGNAFNWCDYRQVVIDALKDFPELHDFFAQFYPGESNIIHRGEEDSSHFVIRSQGTQQGNPAGPFIFCLGLKAGSA